MKARLNYWKAAPELGQALWALHKTVDASGLEKNIQHLVKLRGSQMNGCAHCIELHSREARADGVSAAKVDLLPIWRESYLFDARERAALAWTESLTELGANSPTDALYAEVTGEFPGDEIMKLTTLVTMINTWNRISIAFATPHADPDKTTAS